MSHRTLDEIMKLEAQLREVEAGLAAAKAADVVDLRQVIEAHRKRAGVLGCLKTARQADAR